MTVFFWNEAASPWATESLLGTIHNQCLSGLFFMGGGWVLRFAKTAGNFHFCSGFRACIRRGGRVKILKIEMSDEH